MELDKHIKNNDDIISVKVVLDKKNEKNFSYLVKYNIKEAMKKDNEQKNNFFRLAKYILIDKHNLHFVGNYDD